METFLSAQNVVKQYAQQKALDNVSIQVPQGKIFGLLGPNGAGKTTLIRIINRITAPDSGEIVFNGHPFTAEDLVNIGYLPEERGLYKKMKVGQQAIYLAQLRGGLSKDEAAKRLKQWFEKFDIMPWWNKKLEELSKGMQQKVQFVITILHRPQLLIFDEPFSGFDPVNAELLKQEILQLRREGHTIIFSTHNMASVEEICDEMALINHGKVILNGKVREVKEQFRNGLFEVEYKGMLQQTPEDGYSVVNTEQVDENLTRCLIQKADTMGNSDLISLLAKDVEIRSFREKMPTMHEIFIRTVEANNANLKDQ